MLCFKDEFEKKFYCDVKSDIFDKRQFFYFNFFFLEK